MVCVFNISIILLPLHFRILFFSRRPREFSDYIPKSCLSKAFSPFFMQFLPLSFFFPKSPFFSFFHQQPFPTTILFCIIYTPVVILNLVLIQIIEVDVSCEEVLVHFIGWNDRHDEWIRMDSPRLQPITRKTR